MSVHYSAILSKRQLVLAGFDEFVLRAETFAYVADSPTQAVACLEQLSGHPSDLCVLTYDDRVGLRESIVISEGTRVSYGASDEIWAALDEDGNPLSTVPVLRAEELQDDEEYATIIDAIQLGLDRFGVSMSSQEFRQIIIESPARRA